MDMMFEPLKKYAQFTGRSRRKEYWMFFLFTFVVSFVLQILAGMLSGGRSENGMPSGLGMVVFIVLCLFALAILIPSIALAFRRLHDTNRSAWWLLIGLVPFIGGIVLLVFYVMDGTPGPNKFGPDPKGRGENTADTFS